MVLLPRKRATKDVQRPKTQDLPSSHLRERVPLILSLFINLKCSRRDVSDPVTIRTTFFGNFPVFPALRGEIKFSFQTVFRDQELALLHVTAFFLESQQVADTSAIKRY